jgi:hypothetical protein
MKKKLVLLACFILIVISNVSAQEMQVYGELEFGTGVLETNQSVWTTNGLSALNISQDTNFEFLMPGICLGVRVFPSAVDPRGFFFNGSILIITSGEISGKGAIGGISGRINEKYSISSSDGGYVIGNYSFGLSTKVISSDRFRLSTDLGFNLTALSYDDLYEEWNYWGAGIFSSILFQINLTKKLFLGFGINAVINAFSSIKGSFYDDQLAYRTVSYEDAGRWDFYSVSAHITIGWRFDLKEIWKKQIEQLNRQLENQENNTPD